MASILDDVLRFALRGRYPQVVPPIKMPKEGKPGQFFDQKVPSPEQKALTKAMAKIQKLINEGEYEPFFDVSKRFDVDRTKYPEAAAPNRTLSLVPKKPETIAKHDELYGGPEAMKKLQEAYLKGLDIPDTDKWYFMGQLEKEFIDEYGPGTGEKMFKKMFADSMATWTGGMDPTANLRAAMFENFMNFKKSGLPVDAHQFPYPIGGRFLSTNVTQAQKLRNQGGLIDPIANPKRFNFSTNFLGAADRATMDEQMTKLVVPGKGKPDFYGSAEKPVHRLADKYNTDPRNVQEVIWHGGTGKVGKPMIQFVNEAIERTSRITGLTPKEVVKGMVKGSIPIFGLTAADSMPQSMQMDLLNYMQRR